MDLLKKIYVCLLCVEEKDLLSMKCGHIFCRTCATKVCAEKERPCTALCPACKTEISMETIKRFDAANTLYYQMQMLSFIAAARKDAEADVNTCASASLRRTLPGRNKEASNVVQTPTAGTSRSKTVADVIDSCDAEKSLKDIESSPAVRSFKKKILNVHDDSSPSRATKSPRKRVISEEVTPTAPCARRENTEAMAVAASGCSEGVHKGETLEIIEPSPGSSMKPSRKSCRTRKTPLKFRDNVNSPDSFMGNGKSSQAGELREEVTRVSAIAAYLKSKDVLNDEKQNIKMEDAIKSFLEVPEKLIMIPANTVVNNKVGELEQNTDTNGFIMGIMGKGKSSQAVELREEVSSVSAIVVYLKSKDVLNDEKQNIQMEDAIKSFLGVPEKLIMITADTAVNNEVTDPNGFIVGIMDKEKSSQAVELREEVSSVSAIVVYLKSKDVLNDEKQNIQMEDAIKSFLEVPEKLIMITADTAVNNEVTDPNGFIVGIMDKEKSSQIGELREEVSRVSALVAYLKSKDVLNDENQNIQMEDAIKSFVEVPEKFITIPAETVNKKFGELERDTDTKMVDFNPDTEGSIEFSSDVFTRRKSSEENAGAKQTIEEDGASLADRMPFKERSSIANIAFSPTDKDDLISSVFSDDSDLANPSPVSKICALKVNEAGKTVVKETVSIQSRLSNEEPVDMGLTPSKRRASVLEEGVRQEATKRIYDNFEDLQPEWRSFEFHVNIGVDSKDIVEETTKKIRDALSAANLNVYNVSPIEIALPNLKMPPTNENQHNCKFVSEELCSPQNTMAVDKKASVEIKDTFKILELQDPNEVLLDSSMKLSDNIQNNLFHEWVLTDFSGDENALDKKAATSVIDDNNILGTSETSPGKVIDFSLNITEKAKTDPVVCDNNRPALSQTQQDGENCLPSENVNSVANNIREIDIICLDDDDDDDDDDSYEANFKKPSYDWNILEHVRLWDDQKLLSNFLCRDITGTYRKLPNVTREVLPAISRKRSQINAPLLNGKKKKQTKKSKTKCKSAVKTEKKAIDNCNIPTEKFALRNDGLRAIMNTVRLESCEKSAMQECSTSALPNYEIANTNSIISAYDEQTVKANGLFKSSSLNSDGTTELPAVDSHSSVKSEVTEVFNMEVEQVSQPSVNTLTVAQSSAGHNTSMLGDDEDEDMFILQTPSQELVPRHHSPLLATCFSSAKKAILVEFTRRFGVPILKNFDTNVKYMVMGDRPHDLTPKVLFGMANSCKFLSLVWIEECLRNGVVESTEPFVLLNELFYTKIPCDLWSDINFSLLGKSTFAVDDLKILLEICGGRFYDIDDFKLINTPNKLKMILTFEPETLPKEYVAEIIRSCRAPLVAFSFITNSIANGDLPVVTKFVRHSNQPEIDLARFGYPSGMIWITDDSDDSDEW